MIVINNRDKLEWRKNLTVRDILDKMGYSYSLITVTINGELVLKEDYEFHKIPDNSDVSIFHLAHGG